MSDIELRTYVAQLAGQFQDAQTEITNLKALVVTIQEAQCEMKTEFTAEVASLKAEIADLQEAATRKNVPLPLLPKLTDKGILGFATPNLPPLNTDKGISSFATPTLPLLKQSSGCLSVNTPPPPIMLLSGSMHPSGVFPAKVIEAKKNGLKADMKKSMLANYNFSGEEKANLQPAIKGTMETFKETIQNTLTFMQLDPVDEEDFQKQIKLFVIGVAKHANSKAKESKKKADGLVKNKISAESPMTKQMNETEDDLDNKENPSKRKKVATNEEELGMDSWPETETMQNDEDILLEMDFPNMLQRNVISNPKKSETIKQKQLADVHSKTQKKNVKKTIQNSGPNDATCYNLNTFQKDVLKGLKAWMSKKHPRKERNLAISGNQDQNDIRLLSEALSKKRGPGSIITTIAWCGKGDILSMDLQLPDDVPHMNRMELVWITFHQLQRLVADADFASCLARVFFLVPWVLLLEMEGEEGTEAEEVVNAVLQIATEKHIVPLKSLLSSSSPPDNLTQEIVTWFLKNGKTWVNHAGAMLEYVFFLLSRRCNDVKEKIERQTEMQFNHFLVRSCGADEKNDWDCVGTAGVLAAACMTANLFPPQNQNASALFPYVLNYIIPQGVIL